MLPKTIREALCEKWKETINRQEASGLHINAFCRQEKISTATFYWWKRKLKNVNKDARTSGFVELLADKDEQGQRNRITIHCEGMCRIEIPEGTSPLYIASIVRALVEVW